MKFISKNQKRKIIGNLRAVVAVVCIIAMFCGNISYVAAEDNRKLQNGSFEEGQSFTNAYYQPAQGDVPYWNTTAFQGKLELFRENTGTYVKNVKLTPTDGTYAAELNADEESTLYQNVKTTPSSVYEWGLDHGARNGTDIMALVIGPKQSVNPSKPSKDGRDHFMQMTDWLFPDGELRDEYNIGGETIYNISHEEQFVVYSKKFDTGGTFQDNAGNNAFSAIPSTIYTEEWHIWIIRDNSAATGETENPWGSYGSNAEGSAGSGNGNGSTTVDLSKYYLYTVPAGQTDTLFGFVSVGFLDPPQSAAGKEKTYGNFLDKINFQIYHPLSGSTTTHGSAVVGGSDGTSEGEGSSEGHKVTIDDKLATYVTDGEPLKIQGIVRKNDADAGCEFVGVYYTKQDENGNPVTQFLQLAGNEIEDTGSLTDEEKAGKWIKSTNADGDTVYTYYLDNITSATDLHFIFIKNPTVTYDPNGGKKYVVEREYNKDEAENVYSFKPASGSTGAEAETGTMFIPPYVSKAAEGQNSGWKFLGWLLTGDVVENTSSKTLINADKLGSLLLPAEHTIACDYSISDASDVSSAQYFKIYDGTVALTKVINNNSTNGEVDGVTWTDNGEAITYANVHKGLTMVAQWRWRQAFIPQINKGSTYNNSEQGGTVEITSVTDKTDENYEAVYNTCGKAYYAATDETVTVKATAKSGYTFEGWYDENGNLVTTNPTYSYTETKESVKTYYARFDGNVTQTYIRQVKVSGGKARSGETWEDTEDDNIGVLGRYTYTDVVGTPISSTATAKTSYKFVGWYDEAFNEVSDDMLINDGATISYTTTGDATYYARFERTFTVNFVAQTKQANGTFKTDNVGGKVSVASVTDVEGTSASSKATANSGFIFLGWYDGSGNKLSEDATYSVTLADDTDGDTYYARFEPVYNTTVQGPYLSFIAESEGEIPAVFDDRDAGTDRNHIGYGREKYGNTIATGFKYSIDNMTNVTTIQIDVNVPDTAYVKVGPESDFEGTGGDIVADGEGVKYNQGSIKRIKDGTVLQYFWDATGLKANSTYGFIIDNLYAPGATATITVNGTDGTKVTSSNGVVNTAAGQYRENSHYPG
ncbi:MAG: InlB B-repeat-containing protein [Clostridia bacterium]